MTYEQQVKLENGIRTHVAEQKARIEAAMGEDHYIYIAYDANEGNGQWRAYCHYSKVEFDVKGAMLAIVVDEVIDQLERKSRLSELPRLITHVVAANNDAIITDEVDF